jgi:hypothetical protein
LKGNKEHGYVRRGPSVSGAGENSSAFGSAFEKADFSNTGTHVKASSMSRPVYLNNKG